MHPYWQGKLFGGACRACATIGKAKLLATELPPSICLSMSSWSYPDAVFMSEKSIWGFKVYAMLALKELSEKKWPPANSDIRPWLESGQIPKPVDPFVWPYGCQYKKHIWVSDCVPAVVFEAKVAGMFQYSSRVRARLDRESLL